MGISFKFLIVYYGEMDSKLSNTNCWLQLSDKKHFDVDTQFPTRSPAWQHVRKTSI